MQQREAPVHLLSLPPRAACRQAVVGPRVVRGDVVGLCCTEYIHSGEFFIFNTFLKLFLNLAPKAFYFEN
jgi:hypothetical protein